LCFAGERKGTLETYNHEHTSKTHDSRNTKNEKNMKTKNIKNGTKIKEVNYI
jgi:hypothetical protein